MGRILQAVTALCLLLIAGGPGAIAQQNAPPDSSGLAWLVGTWRGSGTMMGNGSEARLEMRPALSGHFLEMRYTMGPGFEGRAFYRPSGGTGWSGQWFDNRGSAFGITGDVQGRTLTSDWGSNEAGRGRSVYRILDDGRLEVSDSIVGRDGNRREFARHILARAE